MSAPDAVGSRRDREMGELRRRVQELEDVVDEMAGALAALRRHVQLHPTDPEERAYVYGCDACHPTNEARRLDHEFQMEAKKRDDHEITALYRNPTEG